MFSHIDQILSPRIWSHNCFHRQPGISEDTQSQFTDVHLFGVARAPVRDRQTVCQSTGGALSLPTSNLHYTRRKQKILKIQQEGN